MRVFFIEQVNFKNNKGQVGGLFEIINTSNINS